MSDAELKGSDAIGNGERHVNAEQARVGLPWGKRGKGRRRRGEMRNRDG